MAQGQGSHASLDGSGCSQKVADHRFRGANGKLVGMISKDGLNRLGFGFVVRRCGCTVSVDVIDLIRSNSRVLQCAAHYSYGAVTVLTGSCNMVSIGGHAIAGDL